MKQHGTSSFAALVKSVAAGAVLPLAALATGPILARTLGPIDRGHLAAILAPVALLPLIAAMGQQDAATWLVAGKGRPVAPVALASSLLGATTGLLSCGALFMLAPTLLKNYPEGVLLLRLVSITLVPAMAFNALRGVRLGGRAYRYTVLERASSAALRLLALAVLSVTGLLTVASASWAQVLALLAGQFFLIVGLPRDLPSVSHVLRTARESLSFGIQAWGGEVALLVALRLDQTVMLALAGAEQLGYYAVAVALAEVPQALLSSVRLVLMSESANSQNLELIARSARLSPILVGVPALFACALAGPTVRILFGSAYAPAINMARVLLLASVPAGLGVVLASGLSSVGRPGVNSICQFLGLGATVVGVFVFVPSGGGLAAAMVSLVSYTLTAVVLAETFARVTGLARRELISPRWSDLALLREAVKVRRSSAASKQDVISTPH